MRIMVSFNLSLSCRMLNVPSESPGLHLSRLYLAESEGNRRKHHRSASHSKFGRALSKITAICPRRTSGGARLWPGALRGD